jgi:signal transduction histidine kinase
MYLIIIRDITNDKKVKVLEEINEFKNSLLQSVSHELRTPLNGSLNTLHTAETDESIDFLVKEKYIRPAIYCNKILLHIINDILDYSMSD